jgi:hypothetical protein
LIFHVPRSARFSGEMAGDDRRNSTAQGCGCLSVPPLTPISGRFARASSSNAAHLMPESEP